MYKQMKSHTLIDELTAAPNGLSIIAATYIAGYHMQIAENMDIVIDVDQIRHSWLEERKNYVLKSHDVESLSELDGEMTYFEDGEDVIYCYHEDSPGYSILNDEMTQ